MIAAVKLTAAGAALEEFPFRYREGLLWVEVTIVPSTEPLNFLVDTGADMNVIDLTKARQLGLGGGRPVSVRGVRSTLEGRRQRGITAKVGADSPVPGEFLAIDLSKLSGACTEPVHGLIGAGFFRKRVVEIDFEAKKIRVLKPSRSRTGPGGIPLRSGSGGMCVPITVNGYTAQWVRLDTGCATALQWVASTVGPGKWSTKPAVGLAEISIPQTQTTVQLGRVEFRRVPTGLHPVPIFSGEAGLLGTALLAQFSSVIIDSRFGRLLLR